MAPQYTPFESFCIIVMILAVVSMLTVGVVILSDWVKGSWVWFKARRRQRRLNRRKI